jgi:hypothetical protein
MKKQEDEKEIYGNKTEIDPALGIYKYLNDDAKSKFLKELLQNLENASKKLDKELASRKKKENTQ